MLDRLLLIRVTERRTQQTWPKSAVELGRIHQVTLSGPAGSLHQTTRLTDTQAKLFTDCGVPPQDERPQDHRIADEPGNALRSRG